MLVQALAEYADTYLADALNDAAWESKPVPWMIEISRTGEFLSVVPRMTTVTRGKKEAQVPLPLMVPRSPVNRNSGHHPLLGVDDVAYVLGVGPWTPTKAADQEKAARHFEAFVKLIERAAGATHEEALQACAAFYAAPAEVDKARSALADLKPGSLVALSVDGAIVERTVVKSFWRNHYAAAFGERVGDNKGECLITGRFGPIAPVHEKIKGASNLGGQPSGVALMSFDKDAFRSYGWDQNQNSPVAPDRALAYVLALNALLRSSDTASSRQGRRKDLAGIGFLTWLRTPEKFDPFNLMDANDPEEVLELLRFQPLADPNVNRFYMVGVSGNGGRLRVRYWLTDSLDRIKVNLQNWHRQLRLSYPWGEDRPVRFWQLLQVLHREGKPPARIVVDLIRRVLEGPSQPLGYSMLAAALNRLRHPGDKSGTRDAESDLFAPNRLRTPLGLVRICVNDLRRLKGEEEMGEGLDPSCTEPAYICGRLMAEFESLQRASSETEVNSTVVDRYFALASTFPAAAMPKMELLARKHLSKLRRSPSAASQAAARAIELRLQELHSLLGPACDRRFPSRLSLDNQGIFALGYYHQKAWSFAQAKERKQSNQTNTSASQENEL